MTLPTLDADGVKVFDYVEFCPACDEKLTELENQMGYNDPAYLSHLEEMENEHREIRSNYNGLGGTVAEHHDHFAGEDS